MRKNIICQDGYIISQIDEKDILKAVEFVVETNYKKHRFEFDSAQLHSEIDTILESEKKIFRDSFFYMATTIEGKIIGTLRVLVVDNLDVNLPEDIDCCCVNNICHVGRFAINQNNTGKLGNELFKRMILLAFSHVCQNRNNILVAECDAKLHRVLVQMGIDLKRVGEPFFCLGSETVFVYASYNSIIKYCQKYNLLQQL